ncbi:Uncharacterised protein [Hafnia alvei]|nr:Uncharacterised protein [Hafnia alvei]
MYVLILYYGHYLCDYLIIGLGLFYKLLFINSVRGVRGVRGVPVQSAQTSWSF